MTADRDKFHQAVRQALRQRETATGLPEPVPVEPAADLLALFAEELEKIEGELVRAADLPGAAAELLRLTTPEEQPWFVAERPLARALAEHLPVTWVGASDLAQCQAAVTEADWLIADTATVGLALDATQPRGCYLLPEAHVVVGRAEGMLLSLADALVDLEGRGKLPTGVVFITGPSRTADIEKTVVIPAHGPKRLIVVLV